jgi:RNA polymerase sigma factor (sigma-70 family)
MASHCAIAHPKPVDDVLIAVFEEQRASLRGFFIRGAGGEALAEDLLQETVLRVWGHRGSLAGDPVAAEEVREGARRYLWRVARNLMIDEIRWRQRQRAGEGGLQGMGDSLDETMVGATGVRGPAEDIELEDSLRVIREMVDHLENDRVRRCVQLWLRGSDVRGIARQRGLSAGQVRGLLQRGRSEIIRRAAVAFA